VCYSTNTEDVQEVVNLTFVLCMTEIVYYVINSRSIWS